MERSRWWHVAVLGTAAIITVLVLIDSDGAATTTGALASIAVFVLGWFAVGRHAWRSVTAARWFAVIVVVTSGVGTAFDPSFATIQCITYTMVWVLAASLRQAIIANIALAVAVGIGFTVSLGNSPAAMFQVVSVQLLSLIFSLALGLWITSISDRSLRRQQLVDELRAAQATIETLGRDAGIASERERLARELHDTIAQSLTGLVLLAQRARRETDPDAVDAHLAMIEENARETLVETRSLVAASAPVGLVGDGLGSALARLGERFSRESGIAVAVHTPTDPEVVAALGRDSEVVLLRCAQEGLANVRKHSGAVSASVTLAADDAQTTLTVTDDGVGFDAAHLESGFGLPGMRDRLALVGGSLSITSDAHGTTLVATLPLAGDAAVAGSGSTLLHAEGAQ